MPSLTFQNNFSSQISTATSCKYLPRFVRQSKYLNLVSDIFRVRTRTRLQALTRPFQNSKYKEASYAYRYVSIPLTNLFVPSVLADLIFFILVTSINFAHIFPLWEISNQRLCTFRGKHSVSTFLSPTTPEIYIPQSPNYQRAIRSNMLIRNLGPYNETFCKSVQTYLRLKWR